VFTVVYKDVKLAVTVVKLMPFNIETIFEKLLVYGTPEQLPSKSMIVGLLYAPVPVPVIVVNKDTALELIIVDAAFEVV
jgi:hypothetical protein